MAKVRIKEELFELIEIMNSKEDIAIMKSFLHEIREMRCNNDKTCNS